jgi:hypothetical protein
MSSLAGLSRFESPTRDQQAEKDLFNNMKIFCKKSDKHSACSCFVPSKSFSVSLSLFLLLFYGCYKREHFEQHIRASRLLFCVHEKS